MPESEELFWRVVFESLDDKHHIHRLVLKNTDSGSIVFQKLQQLYLAKNTRSQRCYLPLAFCSPVVGTITLSRNSSVDLEAQLDDREVFATHRNVDSELTAALHKPELLSHVNNFVAINACFAMGPPEDVPGRQAVLIGLRMNWWGILALLWVNVLLCVGIGAGVGLWSKKADLGVSVTSAVAAVTACVQAILFLIFKL